MTKPENNTVGNREVECMISGGGQEGEGGCKRYGMREMGSRSTHTIPICIGKIGSRKRRENMERGKRKRKIPPRRRNCPGPNRCLNAFLQFIQRVIERLSNKANSYFFFFLLFLLLLHHIDSDPGVYLTAPIATHPHTISFAHYLRYSPRGSLIVWKLTLIISLFSSSRSLLQSATPFSIILQSKFSSIDQHYKQIISQIFYIDQTLQTSKSGKEFSYTVYESKRLDFY